MCVCVWRLPALGARLAAASNLATTHCDQGKYAEASQLQEEALAVEKRVLGEEHPDALTTAGNLASTYKMQGRYAEAVELQVRAFYLSAPF